MPSCYAQFKFVHIIRISVKAQTIKLNLVEVINEIELCTHLYSMSLDTKLSRRISTKRC